MRRPTLREHARGYAVAVGVSGAAVGARLLLGTATSVPFVTFFPAAMASGWWGGRGPVVLTVVLCAAAGDYFLYPPYGSFGVASLRAVTDLSLFAVVATLIGIGTARLHEVQRRFRSVLEATSDGFAVLDREWRYVYVNRRLGELVRRRPGDLVGRRVWDVFPDAEALLFGDVARAAMKGAPGHFDSYYAPLGRWFETDIYPIPEGIAVLTRDVSAEKELELRRSDLLTELEAANRIKDDFLATLSHELRTPLNALLGWIHLLDRGVGGPGRALASIKHNAGILHQLVDDLLDTSRIMAGKLHIEMRPMDVARVVLEAVDTIRATAESRRIAIAVHGADRPVALVGDPGRLHQAVLNLLSNAVKFTPPGGRVDVELGVAASLVGLTVRDTGIGIAPEALPRIFDRFVQADATLTGAAKGLGLGLAITKHIIEAHGGSLRAESDGLMQGATFTVSLPVAAGAERAAAS